MNNLPENRLPSSEEIAAVDCHAHVMRRDLPLASDWHSAPKRDVTVEEFLGELDAHGISRGVLTGFTASVNSAGAAISLL